MPVNLRNVRTASSKLGTHIATRVLIREATFKPMKSGVYRCNQTHDRVPQARLAGYRTAYRKGGRTAARGWLKNALMKKNKYKRY